MVLTLLLGRDWTANRNEILSRIASDVREKKGSRILMVPELISHDTERRLAAIAGDTSSRFAQVLSFTRLARRICDIVGNAAEDTLDNGGRVVAMAASTRQLHSRLKAYAAVETKPEFLANMVDAVDEFKRCCITPGDTFLLPHKNHRLSSTDSFLPVEESGARHASPDNGKAPHPSVVTPPPYKDKAQLHHVHYVIKETWTGLSTGT